MFGFCFSLSLLYFSLSLFNQRNVKKNMNSMYHLVKGMVTQQMQLWWIVIVETRLKPQTSSSPRKISLFLSPYKICLAPCKIYLFLFWLLVGFDLFLISAPCKIFSSTRLTFSPSYNSLWFAFVTDGSVQNRGFELTYTTSEVDSDWCFTLQYISPLSQKTKIMGWNMKNLLKCNCNFFYGLKVCSGSGGILRDMVGVISSPRQV